MSQQPGTVYYKDGTSYVFLGLDTFFAVSDDAQRYYRADSCPVEAVKSSPSSDNRGKTSSQARSLISTACDVARAMSEMPR